MVCTPIFTINSIADLLVWPTTCDYFFYLKIFLAVFIILAWFLYKTDKKIVPWAADFWSSLSVASIAITMLGIIGTLIANTDGIPMISPEILLIILAITIPIILIWLFKD
jgi:hypothetical protein